MKKLVLFVAILSVITLASLFSSSATGIAGTTKERGVVTFYQPVQLLDVTLKGEYLFVHDDAAMARGESCTYVYKGVAAAADKLVASFHCIPEARTKATRFTVRSRELPTGIPEVLEIQFAGSTEAHRVPETK
jgi:hypothetical protein